MVAFLRSGRDGSRAGKRWLRAVLLHGVPALLLGLLIGLRIGRDGEAPTPRSPDVMVYAYSALDEVLEDGIVPAFARRWSSEHGDEPLVCVTLGGSGDLADRILAGADPDVAIFATTFDAQRLASGRVTEDAWHALPHRGVLARTPVLLHVRAGNPLGISGFDDLTRPGVLLVRPDPATSGLGNWLLLAAYGAALRGGADAGLATGRMLALATALPAPTGSARAAARVFRLGKGDVCPVYGHDVAATPSRPAPLGDVVRPPRTILCEPVVVRLRSGESLERRAAVEAFVDFLWSDEARDVFAAYGLLAPDADAADAGVEDAFTLEELGGPEGARRILRGVLRTGRTAD